MPEAEYFYQLGRTIHGPISFAELAAFTQLGEIRPTTLVRIGDDGRTWGPARNLDGLEFGEPAAATPSGPRFEPPSYSALVFLSTVLMGAGLIALVLSILGLILSLTLLTQGPSQAPVVAVMFIGGPLAAAIGFYVQAALISLAVDLAQNSARQTNLLAQLLERTPPKESSAV